MVSRSIHGYRAVLVSWKFLEYHMVKQFLNAVLPLSRRGAGLLHLAQTLCETTLFLGEICPTISRMTDKKSRGHEGLGNHPGFVDILAIV